MFDNILIATDDSEMINTGIEYTGNLLPDGKYHLISVLDTSESSVPKTNLLMQNLREAADKALERGESILKNMNIQNIDKVKRRGEPGEEILKYAEEKDIDLLVMGTQSKSGMSQRTEVGDTCIQILQHSNVPSLLFGNEVEIKKPTKIFNPTTGSKYSMEASYLGVEFAEYLGGELTLMCIAKGEKKNSIFRRVRSFAKNYDVDMNIKECTLRPEEDIIKESTNYDVIVTSRGRPGFKYKLRKLIPKFALGDLEREIIAETNKPVLFVSE